MLRVPQGTLLLVWHMLLQELDNLRRQVLRMQQYF
jgi:hypothetical protein